MPRIPQYGGPAVGPVQTTGARFRAADNDGGAAGAVARGLQQAGQIGADYAQTQARIEDDLARTNADNLYLTASTATSTALTDYKSKPGKLALDARPGVDGALEENINAVIAQADARTLRYLQPQLARLRASAGNEIASYAIDQQKVYDRETGVAKLANISRQAHEASKPEEIAAFISEARAQAAANARMAGVASDEVLKKVEFDAGSSIHYAKAESYVASGDVDLAEAYVEAHASELSIEHEVALRSALKGPLQLRQSAADFADATGSMSPDQNPPGPGGLPSMGSMFAAIRTQESGGRQFAANGKPLTSSAGAIGVMQVMPKTAPEAARLAGVKWDEGRYRNDAAYNQQIGAAYFKEMLRQFKDPEIAAAAYNAGPGAVQKALAKGGNYLDHLSSETRGYVANFRKRTGSPQQSAQRWDKESAYAAIDRKADEGAWSFERRERAKDYADRHIAREEQLIARREDAADRAVSDWKLGQGKGFTDTSQIPRNLWASMSSGAREEATRAAAANLKPVEPPSNSQAVRELHVIQHGDPDRFRGLDLSAYIGKVTSAELDAAVTDQAKLRGPGGDKVVQARSAVSSAISAFMDRDPAMAALLNKRENPEAYARVAQDMDRFLASVTGGKREPTGQEMDAAWRRAVMPVTKAGGWFSSSESVPRFKAGDRYQVAVPIVARERIIREWRAEHGGDMPPDGVIGDLYIQGKGRAGFWE